MVSRIDRNQVVDTALRLLNEVGLDGLTLRRIAKELNVQAPALYWHFKNKQELLDEMATEMFRRMVAPMLGEGREGAGPGRGWQDVLRGACRGMRRQLLGYRDGGKVFSGTRMTDESYARPLDNLLTRLTAAGFSPSLAARAWWTAYSYTIGVVIEEQSVYPEPGEPEARRPEDRDPAYDLESRARKIGERYPLAAGAGVEMFGDMERNFEAGLQLIIAGVEATAAGG
ncbi:TetR/AcrR family transcriptional regulator C-terminal domain-containing protein [Streptomyces sioyaensis]|uniref:TetR family transcriptional regulator n=1 Tax=Streptomyces sioyaensis TaxID=67364 RepID=A0A4Q1QK82_9ACTN|nr:TetR/AcrR family transcriptional regulator C-terminal domain-containing protein [Streptomyces sioyaensis]MBM4793930.1 TetR/AcrR family transcriptional regulator C-terminal domain-containing protein [Streptomyces sioyaensis]RXS60902.1 TetR family transcriptional regulator [Streptomyces sioyaensis]